MIISHSSIKTDFCLQPEACHFLHATEAKRLLTKMIDYTSEHSIVRKQKIIVRKYCLPHDGIL